MHCALSFEAHEVILKYYCPQCGYRGSVSTHYCSRTGNGVALLCLLLGGFFVWVFYIGTVAPHLGDIRKGLIAVVRQSYTPARTVARTGPHGIIMPADLLAMCLVVLIRGTALAFAIILCWLLVKAIGRKRGNRRRYMSQR